MHGLRLRGRAQTWISSARWTCSMSRPSSPRIESSGDIGITSVKPVLRKNKSSECRSSPLHDEEPHPPTPSPPRPLPLLLGQPEPRESPFDGRLCLMRPAMPDENSLISATRAQDPGLDPQYHAHSVLSEAFRRSSAKVIQPSRKPNTTTPRLNTGPTRSTRADADVVGAVDRK